MPGEEVQPCLCLWPGGVPVSPLTHTPRGAAALWGPLQSSGHWKQRPAGRSALRSTPKVSTGQLASPREMRLQRGRWPERLRSEKGEGRTGERGLPLVVWESPEGLPGAGAQGLLTQSLRLAVQNVGGASRGSGRTVRSLMTGKEKGIWGKCD